MIQNSCHPPALGIKGIASFLARVKKRLFGGGVVAYHGPRLHDKRYGLEDLDVH